MILLTCRLQVPVRVLFVAFKPPGSLFYDIIGLPTTHSRGGLSTPHQRDSCGEPDADVPLHGSKLLCAPQKVSLKRGWVGKSAHNVRRVFEVIASKFSGH